MNEKDLKKIAALLDKQSSRFEKRMIQVFNQGFEEVVLPIITEMQGGIAEIKDVQDEHGNHLERIERKLDAVVDHQDKQGLEIRKIKTAVKI